MPDTPVQQPEATPVPSATPMADTTVDPSGVAPMAVPETPPQIVPETPPTPPTTPVGDAWNMTLPEDLRGHERLKGVESVEDLARKFAEAPSGPTIPEPDKYVLPEGAPQELGAKAHEMGLTQKQLDDTMTMFGQTMLQREKSVQDNLATQSQEKIKEWGESAPDIIKTATQAVQYWDGKVPGLRDLLNQTGYGNHPLIMELFRVQGEELKEGGFLKSNINTPQGKKSTAATLYPDLK